MLRHPWAIETSPFTQASLKPWPPTLPLAKDQGLDVLFPELRHRVLKVPPNVSRSQSSLPGLAAPNLVSSGRIDAVVRLLDGPTGVGVQGTVTLDEQPIIPEDGLWLLRTQAGRHTITAEALDTSRVL